MNVVLGSNGFIGGAVARRQRYAKHIPTSSMGRLYPYGGQGSMNGPLDTNCEWLQYELQGARTVFLCAGKTGGVGKMANDPMSFVYPNVRIHMNVFEACVKAKVKRVVCVGSTTGYPNTPDAVKESQYLEGDLHPAYVVPGNAHRFIKHLANLQPFEVLFFRPSNVYGPYNSFDPLNSHVIEATVRKVAERQDPFVIWGTGNEVRDAIYIDDLADAISCADDPEVPPGDYNVGSGQEMSVNEIVEVLLKHAGHNPKIEHDLTKPTAIPARRVDCSKLLSLGWEAKVSMESGLKRTYDWFESSRVPA